MIRVLLDAISLLVAYVVAILAKQAVGDFTGYWKTYVWGSIWMVLLLLLAYYFMNGYSPMRSRPYRKEALILTRAHLVGTIIIFSVLFLNKNLEYSRQISLYFAFSGLSLILLERFIIRKTLRYFRQIGFNQKHLLIIGAGTVGMEFAEKVRVHRNFGYNVIGFLDDNWAKLGLTVLGKPVLGGLDILSGLLAEQSVDEVVIALPLHAYEKYACIISDCEKAGVRVRIIPDFIKFFPGKPKLEEFDGVMLMNVRTVMLDDPFNKFLKRLFDICVAIIAIILTGPAMILIAIGIKLTSPGPVFFRQERVGMNNRRFEMLKFRSMRINDDLTAATTWTTADDPRKTKFGSFLRRTSLDELPQFLNVLTGTMSVIGPRPERPFFVEQFREKIPKYMVKHQVKPGITGWAQVNGWRGDTSIEKRIECDIYYIENWDLLFDVKILFMTVFKGLVNDNAY